MSPGWGEEIQVLAREDGVSNSELKITEKIHKMGGKKPLRGCRDCGRRGSEGVSGEGNP